MSARSYIKLGSAGFLQTFLVAISSWLIAHDYVWMLLPVSFSISLTWTFNIKRVAFEGIKSQLTYAGGAAVGTIVGVLLVRYSITLLHNHL